MWACGWPGALPPEAVKCCAMIDSEERHRSIPLHPASPGETCVAVTGVEGAEIGCSADIGKVPSESWGGGVHGRDDIRVGDGEVGVVDPGVDARDFG